MHPKLIFLGTGAACGVPTFYCDCPACQEAQAEPRYQRTRCGVAILGETCTVIDAPPELRLQLIREGIQDIDRFFMTHWHYDHSGGVGELEFYVRVKRGEIIPAYMSAETEAWLHSAFWFLQDCLDLQTLVPGDQVETDGVRYTALEAAHQPGTLGYLLETASGKRTAYLPDTGPLPDNTRERLQGIDTLVLDATFWGENSMLGDHHSVESAIQTGLALNTGQIYLTHLSMHYDRPVTNQELETYLQPYGDRVHLAYDGLQIDLL